MMNQGPPPDKMGLSCSIWHLRKNEFVTKWVVSIN